MSGYVVRRTLSIPTRSFSLVLPPSAGAIVLQQAVADITGALADFKSEIDEARTVSDALSIADLLRDLRERVAVVESLALTSADRLGNGGAA